MTEVNRKSGPKVALKKLKPVRTKGRDLDFWKSRLVKHNPADKEWSVRIQHAGKRQRFGLETANREAAAGRAKERFEFVKAHGWEAAIQHFKYGEEKAKVTAEKNALTVGEYIAEVESLATEQSPRTVHDYGKCLRLILSEILESEGTKPTKERVSAIPLEMVTDRRVERWKASRVQKVRGNPQKEKTAKITANTILRQAKALFGKKLLPVLRKAEIPLPNPLPLSGVNFFKEDTSAKFKRKIEPEALIAAAVGKLDAPQGEDEERSDYEARRQCYLAFILVFATGLRKSEADMLEWDSVNFTANELTVETTQYFKPKTDASEQSVSLDPETLEILRSFRAQYPNDRFLLRSKRKAKVSTTYSYYRADPTWKALREWLALQGLSDSKPIHYCRKAITDYMAKKHGIFAAIRHARHTTPQVTARYYSDGESLAPGIGGLFKADRGEGKKIVEASFTAESAPARKKIKN